MGSFQHQRDPGGDSPDGLSQARSIRRMAGPGKKRLRLSGPGDMVGAQDEERSPRWDGKPENVGKGDVRIKGDALKILSFSELNNLRRITM